MIMKKLIICICVFALIGNISYGQNLYDKILLDCYNEGQAKSILCPVFVNGRLPEKSIGYIRYSNNYTSDTVWFIFAGFSMTMPEKGYRTLLHIDSIAMDQKDTNRVFGMSLCLKNYLDYSDNDTMWVHAAISTEWIRHAEPTYIRIATIKKNYYLFSVEYDGGEHWMYKNGTGRELREKVKNKFWKLYHSDDGITGSLW